MASGIQMPETDVQLPGGALVRIRQVLNPVQPTGGLVLVSIEVDRNGSSHLVTLWVSVPVHNALGSDPSARGLALATAMTDWVHGNVLKHGDTLKVIITNGKPVVEMVATSN